MRCQLSKQQRDELSMLFLSCTTITIKIKWIFHRRKRIFFSVWGWKKTFRLQHWFSQNDFTSEDFASASFICLRQTQTSVVQDSLRVKTVLLLCPEPLSFKQQLSHGNELLANLLHVLVVCRISWCKIFRLKYMTQNVITRHEQSAFAHKILQHETCFVTD